MNCLDKIKAALLTVTDRVSHFEASKKTPPYIVWAEDGGISMCADNETVAQVITGTVDLYTRNRDGEPLVDKIQTALDSVCVWRLNSVQYEDDTKLVHYEWTWEVC